jgi:4-hydroxy-tetrahydrodipicolinate synthase
LCLAGTGSNNTREALAGTRHAAEAGADAVLLVDPYYNGPSSLEIRKEYIEPVARAFPDLQIISYVIPGRTGTQLLPEDLALLSREFPNVRTVKEATANLDNMRRTRELCGPDFTILSGDDGLTLEMMSDSSIAAGGVISVASNIAPRAVSDMVRLLAAGETSEAERLARALAPIFGILMVKTQEETPYGEVMFRARNPLPTKTLMAVLGMPAGPCRRPLGRLTPKAMDHVLSAARQVWKENPEILEPAAAFFGLDVERRLSDPACWKPYLYGNTY